MSSDPAASAAAITALARDHGLAVDPDSVTINEAGLDYRVAFATADDGAPWVLRIPRREDVGAKVADEAKSLDLIKGRLSVSVPDWRICDQSLIAYPLLPGEPGLTLDPTTGEPLWHYDRESPIFAASLGRLAAELHRIDAEEARAAGVPSQTPEHCRETWRANLATVRAAFSISDALVARWEAWLGDDSLWPTFSVFTHGELYPAHLLLDGAGAILSVLDWTTAKVSDPALDFAFQHAMTTPATFDATRRAYADAGGELPPRLTEQCAEIMAASPLSYALYALTTQDPEHLAAAAAQLCPPER